MTPLLLPAVTPLHPDEYVSLPIIGGVTILPADDYYKDVCRNIVNNDGTRVSWEHFCKGFIKTGHVIYVENGRQREQFMRKLRERAERRFKRRKPETHTNTPVLLPAPASVPLLPAIAVCAHPVQLVLLPAPGNDLPAPTGYYPRKIGA